MILTKMHASALRMTRHFPIILKRNFVSTPVLASDPIQELFVEKLREYKKKSEDGKLVEVSPEVEKELKNDLFRIEKQFGATGVDMTKFPKLDFAEPKFDPINVSGNK